MGVWGSISGPPTLLKQDFLFRSYPLRAVLMVSVGTEQPLEEVLPVQA